MNINTPNNLLNIVSNPNLIYTTIIGEIIIVTNSVVVILVGKKIKQVQLSRFFGKDYDLNNHRNKFTGGYFNHKNNTLIIFRGDVLVCYCLRNKNVILSENKKHFFNGYNVDTACVFFDKLITFNSKRNITFLDLETFDKVEDEDLENTLNNLPNKVSSCFINFLDIQKANTWALLHL